MATPFAVADSHRRLQAEEARRTQALLAALWERTVDPHAIERTVPTFLRLASSVVGTGRERSALIAARYYAAARGAVGLDALDVVPMRAARADEAIASSLDYVVRATVRPTQADKLAIAAGGTGRSSQELYRQALGAVLRSSYRHTLDGGRGALIARSQLDKDARGWARVSDGSPCAFCAMLVSRGAVYSEATAGFRSHDGCGCGVRVLFHTESASADMSPQARELASLWKESGDLRSFRKALGAQKATPSQLAA